jgi:hypothetical protein
MWSPMSRMTIRTITYKRWLLEPSDCLKWWVDSSPQYVQELITAEVRFIVISLLSWDMSPNNKLSPLVAHFAWNHSSILECIVCQVCPPHTMLAGILVPSFFDWCRKLIFKVWKWTKSLPEVAQLTTAHSSFRLFCIRWGLSVSFEDCCRFVCMPDF